MYRRLRSLHLISKQIYSAIIGYFLRGRKFIFLQMSFLQCSISLRRVGYTNSFSLLMSALSLELFFFVAFFNLIKIKSYIHSMFRYPINKSYFYVLLWTRFRYII